MTNGVELPNLLSQDESNNMQHVRNVPDKKRQAKRRDRVLKNAVRAGEEQKVYNEREESTLQHLEESTEKADREELKSEESVSLEEFSDLGDMELEHVPCQDMSNNKKLVQNASNEEYEESRGHKTQKKEAQVGEAHRERGEFTSQHPKESAEKADCKELRGVGRSDAEEHMHEAPDQGAQDKENSTNEEKEVNAGEEKKTESEYMVPESKKSEELAEGSDDVDAQDEAPGSEIEENRHHESPPVPVGGKMLQRRRCGRNQEFDQRKSKWGTLIVLHCNFLL